VAGGLPLQVEQDPLHGIALTGLHEQVHVCVCVLVCIVNKRVCMCECLRIFMHTCGYLHECTFT
jgi:hypothetical protein